MITIGLNKEQLELIIGSLTANAGNDALAGDYSRLQLAEKLQYVRIPEGFREVANVVRFGVRKHLKHIIDEALKGREVRIVSPSHSSARHWLDYVLKEINETLTFVLGFPTVNAAELSIKLKTEGVIKFRSSEYSKDALLGHAPIDLVVVED